MGKLVNEVTGETFMTEDLSSEMIEKIFRGNYFKRKGKKPDKYKTYDDLSPLEKRLRAMTEDDITPEMLVPKCENCAMSGYFNEEKYGQITGQCYALYWTSVDREREACEYYRNAYYFQVEKNQERHRKISEHPQPYKPLDVDWTKISKDTVTEQMLEKKCANCIYLDKCEDGSYGCIRCEEVIENPDNEFCKEALGYKNIYEYYFTEALQE